MPQKSRLKQELRYYPVTLFRKGTDCRVRWRIPLIHMPLDANLRIHPAMTAEKAEKR